MNVPHFLKQLAGAADLHARNMGIDAPLDVSLVDRLLAKICRESTTEPIDSLVSCYGAWLGEYCIARFQGTWIGLNEPVAPRIEIAGRPYSPMDAVTRRLTHPDAASLNDLVEQIDPLHCRPAESDWRQINSAAWDSLSNHVKFQPHPLPADRRAAHDAIDPWLQDEGVVGKKVLGLAAGGGTHGPLLAMAGAEVTIVDFSDVALQRDRSLAKFESLGNLQTRLAEMQDLSDLPPNSFDIVVHPVSLCYVPSPKIVYQEIFRILRPGGLYVSQQKCSPSLQSTSEISDAHNHFQGYHIKHPSGSQLPPTADHFSHREPGTVEFAHSMNALLGELCRTGMVIEDFQEPVRGDLWANPSTPECRAAYLPPYLKIKARKPSDSPCDSRP